jgi:hypothetical protein
MKMYRSSGAPIDPRHKKRQTDGMNAAMDKLEKELGKCTQENAEVFQKALEIIHEDLSVDFPNVVNIKYPRTKAGIKVLCDKFGSVAFCIEKDELVAYILDA